MRKQRVVERLASVRNRVLTFSGLSKRGFFVDYRYAAALDQPTPPYEAVEALLESRRDDFLCVIKEMVVHAPRLHDGGSVDWGNRRFPDLDKIAAYTMVRTLRPKRILEIGSGTSTLVLKRALDESGCGGTLHCIDPQPRRDIEGLDIEFKRRLLTISDVEHVAAFEPGDILFIDSSHIMLPGMDVDLQFNRMFPVLAPGVIVHVHDIFLPDDYPPHWRERRYSEQNALVGWIMSGYFDVMYAGYFARTRMREELFGAFEGFKDLDRNGNAGSIWLRRRAD